MEMNDKNYNDADIRTALKNIYAKTPELSTDFESEVIRRMSTKAQLRPNKKKVLACISSVAAVVAIFFYLYISHKGSADFQHTPSFPVAGTQMNMPKYKKETKKEAATTMANKGNEQRLSKTERFSGKTKGARISEKEYQHEDASGSEASYPLIVEEQNMDKVIAERLESGILEIQKQRNELLTENHLY